MIGVIADHSEQNIVREFFELFKTPWEFYRENRSYEVVLCAGDCPAGPAERVVLSYSGKQAHFDGELKIPLARRRQDSCTLSYRGDRIPIYGHSITFPDKKRGFLTDDESRECAGYLAQSGERVLVRVGYDLFGEIRTLLTVGQPPANAHIPALELHIALLRDLITGCGISLPEIPPIPEGFSFIACLTHDVDHPSIRQHKLDHTIIGFFWRAIFGSVVDMVRGWMSLRDAMRNWAAAVKLPFVYVGLAKDFWSDFADRYIEVEKGLPSTFFLIPRKNYAGKGIDRRAAALRASRYEAKELADAIRTLTAAGCEVALHGIDAWIDAAAGREEIEEIRRLTCASEVGVRMHWLYYNEKSSATVEKAGASYDSTIGYNEAVGYRAGTTQAFKPLEAEQLLELPLHAMDTALFYLSYLGLSPKEASTHLHQIADNAARHGGCITINWHDRSLAPERLWGGCYRDLIQDLKKRGAWFATAGQVISWFGKRRSAVFETDSGEPGTVRAKVVVDGADSLPGLRLRIHSARELDESSADNSADYIDVAVNENASTSFPSAVRR